MIFFRCHLCFVSLGACSVSSIWRKYFSIIYEPLTVFSPGPMATKQKLLCLQKANNLGGTHYHHHHHHYQHNIRNMVPDMKNVLYGTKNTRFIALKRIIFEYFVGIDYF